MIFIDLYTQQLLNRAERKSYVSVYGCFFTKLMIMRPRSGPS